MSELNDNGWADVPVDSSVTFGAGIPDADLDRLIAATIDPGEALDGGQ
ncbi:hypothetical protein [Mycolicibacter heraklionensis]|nr:hypothetical protein [Mycolicibacter heraklionensis]